MKKSQGEKEERLGKGLEVKQAKGEKGGKREKRERLGKSERKEELVKKKKRSVIEEQKILRRSILTTYLRFEKE